MKVERRNKGQIKAGDIVCDERFEIINSDLLLCTLTDDITLNLEMTARKGRGYRTAEENISPEAVMGLIPCDSTYTPVRRVRYKVENTRVGQQTDFDKLLIEIWTDGTLSPEMALVEASTILRKHFNPFVKYFEIGQQLEAVRDEEPAQLESGEGVNVDELCDKLNWPINSLEPSVRAKNCLVSANIQTLSDLIKLSEVDVLKIKNFGKTSLKEMKKKLADIGMSFGMEMPQEANSVSSSKISGD